MKQANRSPWHGRRQTFNEQVASARHLILVSNMPEPTIVPAQYHRTPAMAPEKRLALAVAEVAMRDAQLPRHRDEVRAWIDDPASEPFSFAFVCTLLDLDVAHARAAMLKRIGR
jgi:hypothetical protein